MYTILSAGTESAAEVALEGCTVWNVNSMAPGRFTTSGRAVVTIVPGVASAGGPILFW